MQTGPFLTAANDLKKPQTSFTPSLRSRWGLFPQLPQLTSVGLASPLESVPLRGPQVYAVPLHPYPMVTPQHGVQEGIGSTELTSAPVRASPWASMVSTVKWAQWLSEGPRTRCARSPPYTRMCTVHVCVHVVCVGGVCVKDSLCN